MSGDLATALRAATEQLAAAGIASARADAEALAAHLLGVARGELLRLAALGTPPPPGLGELVAQRAARVPLQHLTGIAPFRGLDLLVGAGVFVPRPETEVLAGLAVAEAESLVDEAGTAPLVVDLCTGSGAVALAVAAEVPRARVIALELDDEAIAWARRNVARLGTGRGVDLRHGDVVGAASGVLADLGGRAAVVVANPPYIPDGMVPVDPEVRDHDPALALWGGGSDGLAVPRAVVATAAALLRAGGLLLMEHADVQGPAARALATAPLWQGAQTVPDLAGRPRVLSARRSDCPARAMADSRV